MKIVKYIGGLGNQMFIYAFSVALRETFRQEILVDTHYYKSRNFHNGLEIERIFGIHLTEAKLSDKLKMSWYFPNYWIDYHLLGKLPARKNTVRELPGQKVSLELLDDSSDKFYDGYWQSYQYFDSCRDVILKEFTFPKISMEDKLNFELNERLKNEENSVGIHIRRGDYLKNWKYRGLCGIDYYQKAIAYILEHIKSPKFFLFSDDIDWVKENISPLLKGYAVTFVNWNHSINSYKDMQLMAMCKNLIIANSSFSWWAAYLNQNNPIVVAPEKWINSFVDFRIQYKDWITF
ncbi:alpha-1,2-fucosyltransferase [Prevotella sp.]|uniref:alpha-1,2-fucosyltransferase n=1 Tax=Prevotella sp. TaxID=59823 RepID=UPI0025FE6B3E|nr:alpha-1,2-fucosyltransferase [Prevotella sp.]